MGHPLNFNVEITISPFIFESIDLQYLIEFFSSYKSSNLKQNNIFNLKKKKLWERIAQFAENRFDHQFKRFLSDSIHYWFFALNQIDFVIGQRSSFQNTANYLLLFYSLNF